MTLTAKRRLFQILELNGQNDRLARGFAVFLFALILLNLVATMVETLPDLDPRWVPFLGWFDTLSVTVFAAEYLLRLAACTSDPRYAGSVAGRLRFAATPLAIIDLLAILPAVIPLLVPAVTPADLRFLRVLRLLRVFKLTRYSESFQMFGRVVRSRKHELALSMFLVVILLILSSSVMYVLENEVQPEAFSSIPAAMWWGIVTLATVGYGDVYPITIAGRVVGGFIVVLGVGVVALPAAILASGFMDELTAKRAAGATKAAMEACPHCGKRLHEPPLLAVAPKN